MKKYKVGSECIIEIKSLLWERGFNKIKTTSVKGKIAKAFQRYGRVMYYIDIDINNQVVCRQHHEIYLLPVFTKIKIL